MKNKTIIKVLLGIVVLLVLALIVSIILYFTTDILTPKNKLYYKYYNEGINRISSFLDIAQEQKYVDTLKENGYKEVTDISIKYRNISDISENLNVNIEGKKDINNNIINKNIDIKYNNKTDILNFEYIKENNQNAVIFKNIMQQQYITLNASSIKEALRTLKIDENVIDEYINKYKLKELYSIVSTNKDNILKTIDQYVKNTTKNQYSVQEDKIITLNNGESLTAKLYMLELESEQARRMVRDILAQVGNQTMLNNFNKITEEIPKMQIGIYINSDKIVRISVDWGGMNAKLDFLENELNFAFANIDNEFQIDLKEQENKKIFNYQRGETNFTVEEEILQNQNEVKLNANIIIESENIKHIELDISQTLNLDENLTLEKKLEDRNVFLLNNLQSKELNAVMDAICERVNSQIIKVQNDNINSEFLSICIEKIQDFQKKYKNLQNSKENLFNNQFVLFKGQNVSKNAIYNMLDIVAKNLYGYKVNNKGELKIYLEEGNEQKQLAEKMKEIVKESKNNYNVNFEYNSDDKINVILLELYEKK